jgi:hypothetical protein
MEGSSLAGIRGGFGHTKCFLTDGDRCPQPSLTLRIDLVGTRSNGAKTSRSRSARYSNLLGNLTYRLGYKDFLTAHKALHKAV